MLRYYRTLSEQEFDKEIHPAAILLPVLALLNKLRLFKSAYRGWFWWNIIWFDLRTLDAPVNGQQDYWRNKLSSLEDCIFIRKLTTILKREYFFA